MLLGDDGFRCREDSFGTAGFLDVDRVLLFGVVVVGTSFCEGRLLLLARARLLARCCDISLGGAPSRTRCCGPRDCDLGRGWC